MGKNRNLWYGVPIVVLVISGVYLLLPSGLKLFYVLDDAHLADAKPLGTWSNMTCPQCSSKLKRIVIIAPNYGVTDAAWRYAYYCGAEDVFWVADCPGFYFAGWYGPFEGLLFELRNIVAISLIILSGTFLILLAIWTKVVTKKAA